MKKFLLSLLLCATYVSHAQETFPSEGVRDEREDFYVLTNAMIVADYKSAPAKSTMIIRKGIIEVIGANIAVPAGAIVIDLKGKYIYPSFIDLYADYGIQKPAKEIPSREQREISNSENRKGSYAWNEAVHSEYNTVNNFLADTAAARELREAGFGVVLTHKKDGIMRGTGAVVSLANDKEQSVILKDKGAAFYSFNKGTSTNAYPSSLMGSIALLRQTYLDADWYAKTKNKEEFNLSLDALNRITNLPQVFEVDDKLGILRADKVGDEFKTQYIIKGKGDEYQRANEIKATGASLIIPVNFPLAYDAADPYDALQLGLDDMKHWELAPHNAAMLEKAGVNFTITTADLKSKKEFLKNLDKAIEAGLSREQALKALTHTPAVLMNMQDKLGSLSKGKIANFIITSDTLFDKGNVIYQNWVQGKPYELKNMNEQDIRGEYVLMITAAGTYKLFLSGKPATPEMKITAHGDNDTTKVTYTLNKNLITMYFDLSKDTVKNSARLSGYATETGWKGEGQLPSGKWIKWEAVKSGVGKATEAKKEPKKDKEAVGRMVYPFTGHGWLDTPKQQMYLIKNATVWTNEKEGILQNTDVLIAGGKIQSVGNLAALDTNKLKGTNIITIDGTGKHVTAGIIDEHSHIAIKRGVNEGTQAVTSEVSIGDVVDSEDINIYRQLAGGVTTAQLLHGSANPIGGQSAIIKLRWGFAPEKMKFEKAPPFIKFALGENVKQANWGDRFVSRFPQTRMGVEQVMVDAFTRAREYEAAWKNYNASKGKGILPRRDLELEALLEILNGKRFITCHSYVQSEINMLMHVADSCGFKVNTFTHILEGYKVADKMKKHGVAASTFSDWWAYKYEVIDAIPYNGAILYEEGVLTAFNSDDAEMGRRLNQEAAKAVKYGNVPEEEALKFVTLNPAKMLHIDQWVGSIKPGKDADIVIWSDNPLSINAKAEKTFVDGICFYDASKEPANNEWIQRERSRLVQKMIDSKQKGEKTQQPIAKEPKLYHCDTLEHE